MQPIFQTADTDSCAFKVFHCAPDKYKVEFTGTKDIHLNFIVTEDNLLRLSPAHEVNILPEIKEMTESQMHAIRHLRKFLCKEYL